MKSLIIFILSLTFATALFAQPGTTTLTGNVSEPNARPVEFATVLLVSASDSSLIKGNLTDTTGRFAIPGIPAGTYRLRITAMGFVDYRSPPITLSADQSTVDLGTITLTVSTKTLQEVTIRGERPVVERSMGKMVLNVSNSFFKTASSALDVLKRAPSLIVNQDGAISIKGQYTPVVYIDGKQQPLTADELRNLQAADIDQIEVITNASAQFDGETRAVINIKLKRDKTLGWRGSLYSGYFQNQRTNGGEAGGSATYKTQKWAYYGRVGYGHYTNYLTMITRRVVQTPTSRTTFDSDGLVKWTSKPLSYQFSADFNASKNHQIGLFMKGTSSFSQDITTNQNLQTTYATTTTKTLLETVNTNKATNTNIAIDLNYKGTLNENGDQLSAFLDYAYYKTDKTQDFRNDYRTSEGIAARLPLIMTGNFPTEIIIRSFRADYEHPFGKVGKLQLGTKFTWTSSNNDLRYDTLGAGQWVYDPSRSNRFLYDEKIMAGYAQLSREVGPIQIEAGLRVENTSTRGNSLTLDNVVDRSYFRWLPSLKLQRKLDEKNTLSASFSRKMRRPAFWELNPFTLYIDPYTFTEGNPFLLPVTNNTADVTFNHGDLSFSVNYTIDKGVFVQVPIQNDATNVLRYTRINLDTQRSFFVDATAPVTITKWWKTQHYALLKHLKTVSAYPTGGTIHTQAWSWYFDGRHTFSLPKAISLEVSYYYNSPSVSYIYRVGGYGGISLGLQKSVLNSKGNLQFNVSDILNTYREQFGGQFQNLDVSTLQKRNSRQATIRFTYNFGKSTFARKARSSGSADEESRAR